VNDHRSEKVDAVITHGSTVATNALLEHNGARTALVTTSGFRDVIEIGRQNRPSLYDFTARPPEPLVPADLRFEVNERIDHNGEVLIEMDRSSLPMLAEQLEHASVESVAAYFFHFFTRIMRN
jgi:N-methylhydantoinase A